MHDLELIALAKQARKAAYAPYSGFLVGAALLCADGTVYTGCNIENAAFSPTNCAERTAFFKAVSEGKHEFTAMAIVAGPRDGKLSTTAPCGVCRQVMAEFCGPDFRILLGKEGEEYTCHTLAELLPCSFGPDNLQ